MGDVLGVDVVGVYVLGVDLTALIPWENGSEQGKERMFCHPPSSTFILNRSCLMLWKDMMQRLA